MLNILFQDIEHAILKGQLRMHQVDNVSCETYWEVLKNIEKFAQLGQGKGYITSREEEVHFVEQLLGYAPNVVIDIGANVGVYASAILNLNPNCILHLIEPSEKNFQKLRETFGNLSNVKLHRFAISEDVGEGFLYSPDAGGGGELASCMRFEGFEICESVKLARLDDLFARNDIGAVDLIKLDIEGSEFAALKSGSEILKQTRLVQFEFGPCALNYKVSLREIVSYLFDNNFVIYRASPIGLRTIGDSYDNAEEVYSTSTLFAVNRRRL
jgi:FkbM family methyltransferase